MNGNERAKPLPSADWAALQAAIEQFEAAWEQGHQPQLDDFLPADPAQRRVVLAELVHVDLERRLKRGLPARVEDYLRGYPELSANPRTVLELIAVEARLRGQRESPLTPAAHGHRFPQYQETLPARFGQGGEPPANIPGFEIVEVLGRGGMGIVWKAQDAELKRVVALKMIRGEGALGPEEVARFRSEAEALARLAHPNIVAIYGVGEVEGQPYFVLEYAGGGSLAAKWAGNPQDPREVSLLLRTLAGGVDAAHERGILHRDLKPANVLLTTDGTPKVTDFGLAKKLDDPSGQTQTGAIMGTPSYMAPEQADGKVKELSAATDVYALGAILYEGLTGRPPFKGATLLETLQQVRDQEPVSVRLLQPNVPQDLETICLKCLQKDPRRRYASPGELAERLGLFLEGKPIPDRPVGALERSWRWCRRNPAVAGLLGAVAATLLLGTAVATGLALFAFGEKSRADQEAIKAGQEAEQARINEEKARAQKEQKDEQLDLARRNLLTATLLRVAGVYEREPGEALDLLYDVRACPVEVRDATWGFYERACRRWEADVLTGHEGLVQSVAFSPDGLTLASGSWDMTVRLWDAKTGEARSTLKGHTGIVASVAFSPDGQTLVSGSVDKTVRLWDLKTGQSTATLQGHTADVRCVAFSPDGRTVASGAGVRRAFGAGVRNPGEVWLWDVQSGQPKVTFQGHTDLVWSVAFSPDGLTLASGSGDNTLRLWDVETGQAKATLKGHLNAVTSVAYSPDGLTLASGSPDGALRLWDARTGQSKTAIRFPVAAMTRPVDSVAFSPDGLTLALGLGRAGGYSGKPPPAEVQLWDVKSAQLKVTLQGSSPAPVTSVAFSPDGMTLASGSGDPNLLNKWGEVRLWDIRGDLPSVTLPRKEGEASQVFSVAFSPDGRILAGATSVREEGKWVGAVQLWDRMTGQSKAFLAGHTRAADSVAFSPDGQTLASSSEDRTVRLWDVQTGQSKTTLTGASGPIAFSPDGQTLVSGSVDKAVRLWDVKTGQAKTTLQGAKRPFAFSPDGLTLASAGDGAVWLWDTGTGQPRTTLGGNLGTGPISFLAFSPDGLTLAAAVRQAVWLWDARTGQSRATLQGHTNVVTSAAFSPDGLTLASSSGGGVTFPGRVQQGEVRLWDVRTGQGRATIKGYAIRALAFSPDGLTLAGAGERGVDWTAWLWDVNPGQARNTLRGHTDAVTAVAFSPDGQRVFGRDGGGNVRGWAVRDGKEVEATGPPTVGWSGAVVSPDRALLAEAKNNVVVLRDQGRERAERLSLEAGNRAAWHRQQAHQADWDKEWFAAAFHYGRLLKEKPDEVSVKQRYDAALNAIKGIEQASPPPMERVLR